MHEVALLPAIASISPLNISGGVIEIDPATGEPTGILKERAVELITSRMGKKTREEKKRFIKKGLDICRSFGLTSVQCNDEDTMEVYLELQDTDELPLRIFLTPTYNEMKANLSTQPKSLNIADMSSPQSRLAWQRVKIFSDGSLGAETAALCGVESNEGERTTSVTGVLIHSNDDLCTMISDARARGFRVEIHAIGDAAAEQVLVAMELVGVTPEERPVLTHCQVLADDLIDRMTALNVIANVQPSFVPTDMRWVKDRLSEDKQRYAYGKTFINSLKDF